MFLFAYSILNIENYLLLQPAYCHRSHINNEVEDEEEGKKVAEEEDESTFILVITTTHEIDESLRAILTFIIFCDSEAHYDTNDEATQMTQVVHIGLGQTDLDVEK